MLDTVIVSAMRTPIGKFNGSLSSIAVPEMSANLIKHLLSSSNIEPPLIDEVILGHTLQAGCGQNSARQAAIKSGLSETVPGATINKVCGSGMRAVTDGIMKICFDKHFYQKDRILIVGGHENMSQAPHLVYMREGHKMGDKPLTDSMIHDGLTDAFSNKHMGITAENLAAKYSISREEQDEFALISQQKAADSINKGIFVDEILPINITMKRNSFSFDTDESVLHDSKLEKLSALKPVFLPNGTVTAGNASPINDGAAAMIVTTSSNAQNLRLPVMARIVSFASHGVSPEIMGIGPVGATKKALDLANWRLEDVDLIEANEAFAVQAIAVGKELGWNSDRVNVNGGAIALGHPIGASGARIIVTLVHALKRRGGGRGLATLCIGGGMGMAMCIEVV